MSVRASKKKTNIMDEVQPLSKSSHKSVVKEGTAHSTDDRYRALYGGHSPISRIDPVTSTATNSFGGRNHIRRKSRSSIPVSDETHHDRKLETIEIETTHDGEIGGQGVMFDIQTKSKAAVRIRSLTFHSHTIDTCNVTVFTKRGTHRSFEENSTAWTNIVDTTMECNGPLTATAITFAMFDSSFSDELIIEADVGRAIYIRSTNAVRYSLTNSEDAVFAQDSYVQILEGTGLSQEFSDLHSPRMWNGVLQYDLVASNLPLQLPGCEGTLVPPSNDSKQTYGHMFNIRSNYPGGIIIDGIEFQTHKTTMLNYEIHTVPTNYLSNINNNDWNLVVKGSITGGGKGVATAIVGSDFAPVLIEEKTTRGFYITLDTQDLRYAESSRMRGEIFAQNNHISIEVGVGVADYPLGEDGNFYLNRQWCGRVFYRTVQECPVSISVDYLFDVQYLKDLHGDSLLDKVSWIVNSFVENFLRTNAEIKSLEGESGNPISLLSTETINNGGFSSSCASTNDESDLCNTLVSTVTLGDFSASDIGYIKLLLLQQNVAVSDAIGTEFIAKYVGDKPIVTEMQLVLHGVKSSKLGSEEYAYLEDVIKSFLNKKLTLSDVTILTVRVINISVPPARLLIENELVVDVSNINRNLDDEISNFTVDIVIDGIHRPPPDIDFDSIVEDAINFNADELINDLASDNTYFSDVHLTANLLPDPISDSPSSAPNQAPVSGGNDDEGRAMLILIVIGVSVVVMGLIFGVYMGCKAVRKKRARVEQEKTVLFEEPMLDDWSQNSEDNIFGKKCTVDTQKSGGTRSTVATSSTTSDSEHRHPVLNGIYDTKRGSHDASKRFHDHHRPSNHAPSSSSEIDNKSIRSERSARTGKSGRTRRSSVRPYSPSGRSMASSRRTVSPSSRSRASSVRTHSPSGRSRASSQRTHSPSGRSRASSQRTHSPSSRSRASSRKTHSPSGWSKASSQRTHSPSGRSKRSSRRRNSHSEKSSVSSRTPTRSMSRTAEHSEGSIYTNHSTCSSDGPKGVKTSRDSEFKVAHGRNPPARLNKKSFRSFGSESEEDERAGLIRMHPIPQNKRVNRSSQGRRLVNASSDERSVASNSTNSTISTKGRIPGKTYH